MNTAYVKVAIFAITAACATPAPATETSEPVVLTPQDIRWETRSSGVQVAVLAGDPKKPGPFVLRLRYPAGYQKEPHTHPRDAYVTVLSGSYHRGYGNSFDKSKAFTLVSGTFSVNPAGVSHYEWTTEAASLEVHGVGPWSTQYVGKDGKPIDGPQAAH